VLTTQYVSSTSIAARYCQRARPHHPAYHPPPVHAPVLDPGGAHVTGARYLHSRRKRALDVVVAAGVLTLAAPALAATALAIRLETHGHPVYRQRRVGRDGQQFELYKLRTMVSGAENMGKGLAVDEGDDRITRLGIWLRRTSFDEVPNLINVLRGEMSVVGPRPTVQVQVDRYDERQRHRLDARPGITGWAQVNGRASLPWHERIELDVWYVEHASLRLDLRILARTARLAGTGAGLYRGETGGWR
jgi:lipopolysaccharide/colanic/teichoic acid biosynthesis glycosyltransferase